MTKSLLIVDDEINISKSLARILSDQGYEIYTANSADGGLKILVQHQIQVVISDQRMPVMSGIEFLAQVKKSYPDIVCMILSGYADFNTIQTAINEGLAYKFLNKPWDNETIVKQVAQAFMQYDSQTMDREALKFDKLTETLNRDGFIQFFEESLKNAPNIRKMALLSLNLKDLNKINNSMSEEVGDKVLIIIAQRLKSILEKESCSQIGRLGSSEFALILSDFSDDDNLNNKINQLIDIASEPIEIQNEKIFPKINVGVSLFPLHGTSHDILMKFASLALQFCKFNENVKYKIYDSTLQEDLSPFFTLEAELRRAVSENSFVLHYQPIFFLKTKKIIGLEALLRWQHPEQGIIYPDKFLALCESTGIIVNLGEWILNTACQNMHQLNAEISSPIYIAVNLSARQFNAPGLFEMIAKTLTDTKFKASCLVLEITESLLMHDTRDTLKILSQLHDLGSRLAIDDFGTGYSSLNYLKKFPFDFLKIDRSFVQDIGKVKNTENLVIAIIAMAKSLGLKTIAEGVETETEMTFLEKNGCDSIQGHLISWPKPYDELKSFLMNGLFL